MINVFPCTPCGAPLDCDAPDPLNQYVLEGPNLFTIAICPDCGDCSKAKFIRMNCCDQELAFYFQKGTSASQRLAFINAIASTCRIKQQFCGIVGPQVYYYSRYAVSESTCAANGQGLSLYRFTLPTGSYLAISQFDADTQAQQYANAYAAVNKFCVNVPVLSACNGDVIDFAMRIYGSTTPFTATIESGALPPNTAVIATDQYVHLSGTLIENGTYTFLLSVTDTTGGRWQQSVSMEVLC